MANRGRAEGTIRKRADGRWEGRILLGYRNSKRVRPSFYGTSRADVLLKLEQARKQFKVGIAVTGKQTLHTFLARWLEDTAKPRLRPRTYAGYVQHVQRHIDPLLGHILLEELTPQHVQQLIALKSSEGLKPKTIAYMRAVLRTALNNAMRWGLISRNVATLVDLPRGSRRESVTFSPDQARAFLASAKTSLRGALFTVALAVGLRLGEALGLAWEHVDLPAKTLRVRRALQRQKDGLHFVDLKTDRSRRTVTLPDFAVTALGRQRAAQKKTRLAAGTNWWESGLIFVTSIGTALDERNVRREFKAILKEAELPLMRIHDLRHSCASLLLVQGVHPRVVMELLGHSQFNLTMDTYSHVMPALGAAAAEQMNTLVVGERGGVTSGVKSA